MQQKSELPEGWELISLNEVVGGEKSLVVGGPFGSNLQVKDYRESGIPIIRLQNIGFRKFFEKDIKYISPEKAQELEYHSFKKGDLVLAKLGTPIGKTCQVPDKYDWGIVVADVVRIRIENDNIYKNYLLHYLNSPIAISQLNTQIFGTTRPRVNLKQIREIEIPLPPLAEQHRIVAAIEALFARLDATETRLARVPEIMKQFRQSVLAAACEGRLTEDWREENSDLMKISDLIAETKNSVKRKGNYKIKKINNAILPKLPILWEWHSIYSVSQSVTVGHVGPMKDEYVVEGIPFLRSQNVRENQFDPQGMKYISNDFHSRIKKSILKPRDLVIVRSGNVGTACVIPDYLIEANCSDLVIVKQPIGFIPQFGSYYLNSVAKTTIEANKVGIALSHFNTQSVANLPIPLPPLPEQHEIVRRVDALLKFADQIEARVTAAQKHTEQLRQSILEQAFSGRLVMTEAEIAREGL